MDQPSAQSVGREFVRQYYTMLHEAPQFLYRFYSHNSSFVHGGVEKPGEEQPPAVGQADIFKKIASLDFKDCHAKIRQVDSQASIDGSVVIQVVGELSNDGSPMRRFMQTFVLAPQSPKKYYLHNDIFRYQDEVFLEPGSGAGGESETDGLADDVDEHEYAEDEPVQQQPPSMVAQQHDGNGAGVRDRTPVPYYEPINGGSAEPTPVVSNGDAYPTRDNMAANPTMTEDPRYHGEVDRHPSTPAIETVTFAEQELATVPMVTEGDNSKSAEENEEGVDEKGEERSDHQEQGNGVEEVGGNGVVPHEPPRAVEPGQKLSWAAITSRNTSALPPSQPSGGPTGGMGGAKPQATIRPEPKSDNRVSPPSGALPQRPPRAPQQQHQVQPLADGSQPTTQADPSGGDQENSEPPSRPPYNRADNVRGGGVVPEGSGGGPQPQLYPDNQQVFVGNVPHGVTDLELKEYFEQYGPVVDMRINRKPATGNYTVPNFGFVTFETVEAVQNILSSMPLPKMHGRYRINVEEKKPREELAAGRPRSGTRPIQGGGGKPFPRESYSPRGGRGGGQYNNGGGRGNGPPTAHNGGGAYAPASGRSYTKSFSSDDGRAGPSAAPAQQQR